ncbi:hypothetical protein SAY86_031765 [Trapa natans]|uniref:CRAL-TRIO domain-containing protein n=1 Tax=Trapa natans TaxID=22666 RepID=A0AAN7LSH2_TRANT|nr:hypothetical protein SAY86_031765 [Trapa natans]
MSVWSEKAMSPRDSGSVTNEFKYENSEEEEQEGFEDIEEKLKIGSLRAIVERDQDPSSKDVDDYTLRRFLRARDLNVEKASNMFLKYLSWRKSFVPNGTISLPEIPNEVAQNKMFMQGVDRKGRPILIVFGNRHKPSTSSPEEFKRFVVFGLDKICERMPHGKEKFVAIGDLEGWGYANSDIRGYLAALSILQDCYPERLGRLLIVNVPYIFMAVWKMVYPFIDSTTKKKINLVENKKLRSTLLAEIDEDQLPEVYGGKLPLVPIQDC